jgi:serine/threonine protein kinase
MCKCQFNVLVDSNGRAFVRGSGLSTMLNEIAESKAHETHLGDIRWTAPELVVNVDNFSNRLLTSKSDVWSFGCIMVHVHQFIHRYSHYHLTAILGAFWAGPMGG